MLGYIICNYICAKFLITIYEQTNYTYLNCNFLKRCICTESHIRTDDKEPEPELTSFGKPDRQSQPYEQQGLSGWRN